MPTATSGRPKRDRRNRQRYKGWAVLCSDTAAPVDRWVREAGTEDEARELVRKLNAEAVSAGRAELYWCEWWSTSSQLERAIAVEEMPMPQVCRVPTEDEQRAFAEEFPEFACEIPNPTKGLSA